MKAVIDSDVLIDYLRGVTQAKREIDRYSDLCYSVVSWMEVMCGAETEDERMTADALLSSMRMIALSDKIAKKAVEARKKYRFKLPDAVIWATADLEGCILVTRNTKDFDKSDPRIRIPYHI